MNINNIPLNTINYNAQSFGHSIGNNNNYSKKQKAIVTGTTLLGAAAGCAVLAKKSGYSLKPSRMFKNIKNSYLAKADFEAIPVITIGAGTCLGGLAGGYMIDKNPENRKAKRREAVMQIGNISIPILTVAGVHKLTHKYGKEVQAIAALGGVFAGVWIANFLMNKLGNALFHNKEDARGVKATDFSAHLDDFVLAATYVSKSDIVHALGRLVPAALMVPGYEIGTKESK